MSSAISPRAPEAEAREIALALELFTTGSLDIFGHDSTVDLDKRVVVFDIPEQYRSDSNMKIEVMQDGSIIHSTYVDGGTASFTYTFHGSAGSTSTIKLYINGTEAVAQEITF